LLFAQRLDLCPTENGLQLAAVQLDSFGAA
jgi:hypothetical protein